MQILPDTFLDRAEDALGAARLPVPGDEGFARALNQSVQDIRNNQADPSAALYATVSRGVDTVLPQTPQPGRFADGAGRAPLPAHALEQIEQAVLTAGKNGVQRLEVPLRPKTWAA